jgi:hypothetical protein
MITIDKITIFQNPEGSSYQVRWFDVEGKDRTLNTETFDDEVSAKIFAIQLQQYKHIINNEQRNR